MDSVEKVSPFIHSVSSTYNYPTTRTFCHFERYNCNKKVINVIAGLDLEASVIKR